MADNSYLRCQRSPASPENTQSCIFPPLFQCHDGGTLEDERTKNVSPRNGFTFLHTGMSNEERWGARKGASDDGCKFSGGGDAAPCTESYQRLLARPQEAKTLNKWCHLRHTLEAKLEHKAKCLYKFFSGSGESSSDVEIQAESPQKSRPEVGHLHNKETEHLHNKETEHLQMKNSSKLICNGRSSNQLESTGITQSLIHDLRGIRNINPSSGDPPSNKSVLRWSFPVDKTVSHSTPDCETFLQTCKSDKSQSEFSSPLNISSIDFQSKINQRGTFEHDGFQLKGAGEAENRTNFDFIPKERENGERPSVLCVAIGTGASAAANAAESGARPKTYRVENSNQHTSSPEVVDDGKPSHGNGYEADVTDSGSTYDSGRRPCYSPSNELIMEIERARRLRISEIKREHIRRYKGSRGGRKRGIQRRVEVERQKMLSSSDSGGVDEEPIARRSRVVANQRSSDKLSPPVRGEMAEAADPSVEDGDRFSSYLSPNFVSYVHTFRPTSSSASAVWGSPEVGNDQNAADVHERSLSTRWDAMRRLGPIWLEHPLASEERPVSDNEDEGKPSSVNFLMEMLYWSMLDEMEADPLPSDRPNSDIAGFTVDPCGLYSVTEDGTVDSNPWILRPDDGQLGALGPAPSRSLGLRAAENYPGVDWRPEQNEESSEAAVAALLEEIEDDSGWEADDEFECDCPICMLASSSLFDCLQQRYLSPPRSRLLDEVHRSDDDYAIGDPEDILDEDFNWEENSWNVPFPAVDQDFIEQLPRFAATKDHDGLCAICRVVFSAGDELISLPCLHFYHPECISKWLGMNSSCPICRLPVTDQQTEDMSD